jgi:hypothetical protein
MDVASARREPAWQEYHTGSPAAGRESAARAMCSSGKDVLAAYEVACARGNHFFPEPGLVTAFFVEMAKSSEKS